MSGFRKLLSAFGVIGAASRVAGACEAGARPASRDLRRLGIDPQSFTSMGHG